MARSRSRAASAPRRTIARAAWRSSLDRGAGVRRAVGVVGQERRQRNGGVRVVLELGKPLLAKAVVEAPLHRAQLALRHAIRGPRRVRLLRAFARREVRQVLEPDALGVLAMARRAREVVSAAAVEEHLLA